MGIAAVIVVGVVIGVVVAATGGGSPKHHRHAAAGGTTAPGSTPPVDVCPDLAVHAIATALHVTATKASPTSAAAPTCAYRTAAGDPVLTLETSNDASLLALHTFATTGAVKVPGLGGYAIFAPRPPRLAFSARGGGVLLTLLPAGYRALLPGGAGTPIATERAKLVAPLTKLARAVQRTLH